MSEKSNSQREPISIIHEIESQLEELLAKKKEEIEKALEEKIRKEREEAKKKMEEVEREIEEEKQSLLSYRNTLEELDKKRADLKTQIKEHLNNAIHFQSEIETLTAKTLEELKLVSELTHELEELNRQAEQKAADFKRDLEEKYGIVAEVFKHEEVDEMEMNLEEELLRLKKIKELLRTPTSASEAEKKEAEEKQIEEREPEQVKGLEETLEREAQEEKRESVIEDETLKIKDETAFKNAFLLLEKYRKTEKTDENGELSYFEYKDKIVLDGESLISSLSDSVVEAKKLFIKLSQTESPKDQFFIKQEIIRHQESLRKLMLRTLRLCEKESCSLPSYTIDILNVEVIKEILEKVSMENWSNKDDFSSFDEYAKQLKEAYYALITPPGYYLKSLVEELGIE